jgi:hypothetical protein
MSKRWNFDSSKHGRLIWSNLAIYAFSSPKFFSKEEKREYKYLFTLSLTKISCPVCRKHSKQLLKKFPLSGTYLSGRDKLIEWLYKYHLMVNKSLKKPFVSKISYDKYWKSKIVGHSISN